MAASGWAWRPDSVEGFDALPHEIRDRAASALVRSIDPDEILRALRAAADLLLEESNGLHNDAAKIQSMLREILD